MRLSRSVIAVFLFLSLLLRSGFVFADAATWFDHDVSGQSCFVSAGVGTWSCIEHKNFSSLPSYECYCLNVHSSDSDGDGLPDGQDPFPNSAACPNQGQWVPMSGAPAKECQTPDGGTCTIQPYQDISGICPPMVISNCPDNVSNCKDYLNIFYNQPQPQSYQDLVNNGWSGSPEGGDSDFSGNGSFSVYPDNTPDVDISDSDQQNQNATDDLKPSAGESGNASPDQVSDSDLKVLADYLAGIQNNLADLGFQNSAEYSMLSSQLNALNQRLSNLANTQYAQTAQIGQLNNSLQSLNSKLDQLTDTSGLSSDALPDPNSQQQQLDSDEDIQNAQTKIDDEKNALSHFLDNAYSDIKTQFFDNAGVQIDSSVCSFSGSLFGKQISISFCDGPALDLVDTMGDFMLGLAGLVALFIIFA